ncbi:MAG: hypothetical protein KKB30_15275 [Proteobacteria bacterium]|nr:hypothetical protein [Pseudomonadota bacterium]MBU1716286.1 hypothetical protein [Pseudomonadota bacterium]
MGYDAVGIARQDLANGLDFFKNIVEQSKFTWLSANIVSKLTGKPVFTPSISRRIGEINTAIIGLTDDRQPSAITPDANMTIEPWQNILPTLVHNLSRESDFIVLLSSLTLKQNIEIANKFPAINLIITSEPNNSAMKPRLENNTLLCSSAKQGKYFGWLQIKWGTSGKWEHASSELMVEKKNSLDRINWQLKRLEKNQTPKEDDRYQGFIKMAEEVSKEISMLEKMAELEKPQGKTLSTYKNQYFPMQISSPDHEEVLKIVHETKRKINLAGKASSQKADTSVNKNILPEDFAYVGWLKCSTCHANQAKGWQDSRHAGAYMTLVRKGQQFDRSCIACHVTGIETGAESFALALPPTLQQVGCETCHGPGKKHSGNPKEFNMASPNESICLRCHQQEHDDSFDFAQDLEKLRCTH